MKATEETLALLLDGAASFGSPQVSLAGAVSISSILRRVQMAETIVHSFATESQVQMSLRCSEFLILGMTEWLFRRIFTHSVCQLTPRHCSGNRLERRSQIRRDKSDRKFCRADAGAQAVAAAAASARNQGEQLYFLCVTSIAALY